ncbi:MAG TPA: ATP-grasp domain-containing protein, partial [Solirubrobacteraceae bacterium]
IVPYASAESLRRLRDKTALAGLAEAAGLAAPLTLAEGPAGALAADPPPAPCVVKSTWGKGGPLPVTRLVETDAELRALLEELPPDHPLLIQERLAGPLIGLAVVIDRDGRLVARFQQVALRLWPLHAGGSSVAISVAPDPALCEHTAALLRGAGFWGLAQVQFLTGARGPALIDVNPRYYGSMPLATAAGVNLPAAWQAVALGERLGDPPLYREGVTYRWLEADLRAALHGSRGHLRPVRPRPSAGTQWAADDPLPAALLVAQAVAGVVARRF